MRKITYTVSIDGITPDGVQYGGIQGEHNATDLEITVGSDLAEILAESENYYYRIDAEDSTGAHFIGAAVKYAGEPIFYSIPQSVTAAGGKAEIRIIFTEIYDGQPEKMLFSFPFKLYFDDSFHGDEAETKAAEGLCEMVLQAQEHKNSAEAANIAAENAKTAAENAANEALSSAETAVGAKNDVKQSADTAQAAATSAQVYAENAASSEAAASKAQAEVEAEIENALNAVAEAKAAAVSAENSSQQSEASAEIAQSAAESAASSSTAAQSAASTAKEAAKEAAQSAIQADAMAYSSVKYTEVQSLTSDQQKQARENIGMNVVSELTNGDQIPNANAVSAFVGEYLEHSDLKADFNILSKNAVKVTEQSLTDEQKQVARENIGAFDASKVIDVENYTNAPNDSVYNKSALQNFSLVNLVTASPSQSLSDRKKQIARNNVDVDGGKWELLYTIEGDGETRAWEYTQFADGTPLKLTAVAARIIQEVAESASVYGHLYGYYGGITLQSAVFDKFFNTTGGEAYGEIRQDMGYYSAFSVGMASKNPNTQRNSGFMNFEQSVADNPYIDAVKISNQTAAMSAGNKIEVWGVRYYE